MKILAGADFGFSLSLVNSHNVAKKLAHEASQTLISENVPAILSASKMGCTALTEPGTGSDLASIQTTATKESNVWQLKGRKAWIINATQADIIILYAQTNPGSGTSGIAAFLIDSTRPGFIREPGFDLAGQHSMGTGGFRLEGYEARPDELLARPGKAIKFFLKEINEARTYVAAMCCGMVETALDICRNYGRKRKTFGKTLNTHQGWLWSLSDAETDLAAAQLLVQEATAQIEKGADTQLIAAQAKIFSTRMAERHLPNLTQLMGAEGLREKYPFSRHLIASRIAGYVEGSTEMLLERVAACLK